MATRWRPDTCGCVVEYTDPNDLPGSSVVITTCPEHTGVSGAALVSAVHQENRRKNLALPELLIGLGLDPADPLTAFTPAERQQLAAFTDAQLRALLEQGAITRPEPPVLWNFTVGRVLEVRFRGRTPTAQQRVAIQAALDSRFGVGRVVLL